MYAINKQLVIKHAIKRVGLQKNTVASYGHKPQDCQSGRALDTAMLQKIRLEAKQAPKLNEHQQMLIDLEKEAERNLKLSKLS